MKTAFLIIVFVLAGLSSKAQSGTHTNLGIKVGPQAAKLGQPKINWDTRYSWHAGLVAHVHMSRHFAIQPELLYSAQGAEHVVTGSNRQINLGYLNLPVAFQYMTGSGFRLQAGPQLGFLLDAKRELNGTESDIKNSIKKMDLGALAGFSYVTKLGLGLDARYIYGLVDIAKEGNTAALGSDLHNMVIQVGLFYQFKHK
ncbi:MAG TPA: porin family protein [Segetibacter sp.]|jgi:hypothetical protein